MRTFISSLLVLMGVPLLGAAASGIPPRAALRPPGPSSAGLRGPLAALAIPVAAPTTPGSWTSGAFSDGLSLLLTDGSIFQQTSFSSAQWQRILPDATGHYDWTHPVPAATMQDTRGFFASVVMRDGRVFVAGGEYGTGSHTAEIYDPITNTWTPVPNPMGAGFYDCTAVNLPDGRVLVLPNGPVHGYILDPGPGTWTPTSDNAFPFNETCVAQLPGGAFFMISATTYPATATYLSATNQWVVTALAPTGADAVDSGGEGTKVLLYDGRVMTVGTTGKVGFYSAGSTPTDPGSWTPGPFLPDQSKRQDAFMVVLPNGHVFLSADQGGHTGPTRFYDFDPSSQTFVDVSPVAGGLPGYSDPYMPLLLPTGEVFVAGIGIYTPSGGGPQDSWRPVASSIADLGGGTYRLTGQQLSGLTEGAYYGDDAQMSTNYPLLRLTAPGGAIVFARSFNVSTMALSTATTPETTEFTLPPLADGPYSLEVVTNAVPSLALSVQIQGGKIVASSPPSPSPSPGPSSGGGGTGGGGGGGGCGATGLEVLFVLGLLGAARQRRS
ncbi:MAG TPA: kelch repeat-containing protein [Planctomycetota bacterium]|nr:kelch repeat-containing protein [Planctomycetota bacterium]